MPAFLAACLIVILSVVPAVAMADDLAAAEDRARRLTDALDQENSKYADAAKQADAAGAKAAEADAAWANVVMAADRAGEASKALMEARKRLEDEKANIRILSEKLKAIPDDAEHAAERQKLERLISAYIVSLKKLAAEYGKAAELHRQAIENAKVAIAKAEEAFRQAEKERAIKEAALAAARAAREAAAHAAAEAKAALYLASRKAAPPYLKEVKVTQKGKLVYHARWAQGASLADVVRAQIEELEAQNAELVKRLGALEKARKDIFAKLERPPGDRPRTIWTPYDQVREMGWRLYLAMSGQLYRVQREGRDSPTKEEAQALAKELDEELFWRLLGAHGLYWMGYNRAEEITEDMVVFQARQLAGRGQWKRKAVGYVFSPPGFKTPSFRALVKEVRRAEVIISRMPYVLADLDARRTARQAIHEHLKHRAQQAYQRKANEFHGSTGPRDAVEKRWRHYRSIYDWSLAAMDVSAYEMVSAETNEIDKLIQKRRDTIENLHRLLSDAHVRRLEVLVNNPLDIGPGLDGEIALTFSAPLGEAPSVLIGEDLPAGSKALAARVKVQGKDKSWSGTFYTEPLMEQPDIKGGIRLHVTGKDHAGKALDGDPTTEAGRMEKGKWKSWEYSMHRVGPGTGGPDMWHLLNLHPTVGTSYCFVVDASGSMREQGRMDAVKASAKSFVEKMEEHDEVALWVFYGCGKIQLLLAFTNDRQKLVEALAPVRPDAGTPLAAAISMGGDYLVTRGKYDNKALVILTDGEETCQGNPQVAAAKYRKLVRVFGYGAGGPPPKDREAPPDKPKDKPDKPEREPPVKVQPADRKAYSVRQTGSKRFPSLILVETHFHEWGRDGSCCVLVTEKLFYCYYGESMGRSWGVNSKSSGGRTLAAATSAQGQAAMDLVRKAWKDPPGTTREEAETDIELRVHKILDALKKEDGS